MAALDNDAPIISYSSLSKAYLAPGWRAGWMAVGSSPRLDPALAAIKKLADGRLCSPGPMQYAVTAALTGDRSHQVAVPRSSCATRAELTTQRMNAIAGMSCVVPTSAFYAMPKVELPPGKTDTDFVLGLLRAKGVLTRLRLGLRHRARRRLLPHRVPRLARRAQRNLRRCRRLHRRVPILVA